MRAGFGRWTAMPCAKGNNNALPRRNALSASGGIMSDPLAHFRKKPGPGGEARPTAQEPDEYVAFGAKDKVERLRIRRAFAPTRSPGYAYLLDIAYDGPFGTNFVLVYTFLMVMVRG